MKMRKNFIIVTFHFIVNNTIWKLMVICTEHRSNSSILFFKKIDQMYASRDDSENQQVINERLEKSVL